ncbi:MAG: UvrD-helicase domain-containing protein, partial [Candidatus Promineifilaceae bacterium]
MKLRPAQEKILDYRQGKMAISAVPGSGKTTTLALLAAELIARGQLDPTLGRSILIVTYLNTSVENFRANIGRRLAALELPPEGFEVRTLHSLALEIVRAAFGGGPEGPAVADEGQANHLLARAVDSWTESNPALWAAFLSGGGPQHRVRWRDTTEGIARQFIREAKNGRLRSESVLAAVQQAAQTASGEVNGDEESTPDYGLLWMMAGIYDRYQSALGWQGVLDFDDLVWRSVDLIESRPDLAAALRGRWPYVLEDEAQDSVPLQETLLELLTGPDGNWVRVGDPNQAITSTFTAAHPRFFNHFLARPDVVALPLPNSGRSSRKIIGAANQVMEWACDLHPIPEVRETAFRRQEILPTPPGDSQPNPADAESDIRIRVYSHREDDELPAVARLAAEYARRRPEHTLAILVPTNEVGRKVSEQLDALDASYDDLLRGGGRLREIAAAIQAVVGVLANPQSGRALELALTSLYELGHPAAAAGEERFSRSQAIVRSVHRPETFLFPAADASFEQALPSGVADEDDLEAVGRFRDYLQELFELRPLPVDDLILALSDELFAGALASNGATDEGDLALGYRLANVAREWRDLQPSW